jgi:hypothetical protein
MIGTAWYQILSSIVHGSSHGVTQEVFQTAEDDPNETTSEEEEEEEADLLVVAAPMAFMNAAFRAHDQFGWDSTEFQIDAGVALMFLQMRLKDGLQHDGVATEG